jgi:hypothetical protein
MNTSSTFQTIEELEKGFRNWLNKNCLCDETCQIIYYKDNIFDYEDISDLYSIYNQLRTITYNQSYPL